MTYESILQSYARIAGLNSIKAQLYWDQDVFLPKNSRELRARQIQLLDEQIYGLSSDVGFLAAIEGLQTKETEELGQIRQLKREIYFNAALDSSLAKECSRLESLGDYHYSLAKESGSFQTAVPYLDELLAIRKEAAKSRLASKYTLNKEQSLYDLMVSYTDHGLTNEILEDVFNPLKVGLIDRVAKLEPVDHPSVRLTKPYDYSDLIEKFGFDLTRGRIEYYEGTPFCGGSLGDIRLTTSNSGDFTNSLLTTMHELGHGLYDQSIPSHFVWTPAGQGVSTSFHESQSRFYENQICRSDGFIKYLSQSTGESISSLSGDLRRLYKTPIRVDADEVSYNLHIILRWEIEQALITGDIRMSEVPGVWNDLTYKYFGIEVKNDLGGCLQDTHWFIGDFGWFPSYALGNVFAAQFYEGLKSTYCDYNERLSSGKFLFIKDYFKPLHQMAGTKDVKEASLILFGSSGIGHEPLLKYLDERYFK